VTITVYTTGLLMALGAMVLYAASTILTKLATNQLDSATGLWIVMVAHVGSSLVFVLVRLVMGLGPDSFDLIAFGAFCLGGYFTSYLGRFMLFETVVRLGAARASAFQTSSPVFTAIFAWVLLGEVPGVVGVVAMALTITGLIIMTPSERKSKPEQGTGKSPFTALLVLGLTSAAAYAAGNICRAFAVRNWNEPVLGVMLGAATALLIQMAMKREFGEVAARLRSARWSAIRLYLVVGLIGTFAQVGNISAMRYMPASEVALILMGTPVLVFPVSWMFMRNGEDIDARAIGGLALALCGLALLAAKPMLGL